MMTTKLATAVKLAKNHFEVDPNVEHVYLLEPLNEDDPRDPIKLLEVVRDTLERGVEPIGFAADPARGIDYPFIIVEVSPREYSQLAGRPVSLRQRDWMIGQELMAS